MREGVVTVDENGREFYDLLTPAGRALFDAEFDALSEDPEPEPELTD